MYGLTSQTRRSVISITANMAETYTAFILNSGS
ncbi:MAG: four helix bundle protein [Proteobacteria bacterium]|nr:four helix bundle protein [Pseudomonadota bacterium]